MTWASLTMQLHNHNLHNAFNTCTQMLCAVLNQNNRTSKFSLPIISYFFFLLLKHFRKLFASSKHNNNSPETDNQKVIFTCRNSRTVQCDSNGSTQEEVDHHTDGSLDNAAGDYLKEKCSSYHTAYKNTTCPFNLRLGRKTH